MISMIKTQWSPWSFFDRPAALILALANVALVVGMVWFRLRHSRKSRIAPEQAQPVAGGQGVAGSVGGGTSPVPEID